MIFAKSGTVLGWLMVEATEMEEGPARRQAVLAVVRELLHLRRADRAYERAGREEELHERASAEYLAKRKREIEAPVEGELRWRRAQYVIAEEQRAECEAAGEPVPDEVSQMLAAKGEFDGLERRWREHVTTYGSGAPR